MHSVGSHFDDRRKKLDAKSHACIMMGYFKEWKAYKLFDPIKQEIIYKRYVVFDEKTSGITSIELPARKKCSEVLVGLQDQIHI
jgi:hypothetical protein